MTMRAFFASSDVVDYLVLRPLSHIRPNWELTWDRERSIWRSANESYADAFNLLIDELEHAKPPARYHDNEDRLAEYVVATLHWDIRKIGNRWIGEDYTCIIEQGGCGDVDQQDLTAAAAGRIQAARHREQNHFDEMEESHQRMLAAVLSVILYHRSDDRIDVSRVAQLGNAPDEQASLPSGARARARG